MGQGPSKPPGSSTEQVFSSNTPVRFSPDLINDLQASPETDTTRSLELEQEVQKRVHDELNRLSQSASTRLAELSEQISATPDVTPGSQQAPAADGSAAAGVAALTAGVDGDRLRDLGRESVLREIQTLKHKLKFRKLTEGVVGDASEVGNVKEKLVKCLRENDRRPLDCWQEVQQFKSEVARLERGFLGKVMQ